MRARSDDLDRDEEEVVERTPRGTEQASAVAAVVGASVLSLAVATVASVLWQRTDVAWPLVALVAAVATAVGALAALHAWRRRVRSLLALGVLVVCACGGPTVLSWVAYGLLLGRA